MRVILDECVDFAVCDFLNRKGYDALHVKDSEWRGFSNSELYQKVRGRFDLFLTSDSDFRNPEKYAPTPETGVMYIRIVPPIARYVIPALERFLADSSLEAIVGRHVIVRRNGATLHGG